MEAGAAVDGWAIVEAGAAVDGWAIVDSGARGRRALVEAGAAVEAGAIVDSGGSWTAGARGRRGLVEAGAAVGGEVAQPLVQAGTLGHVRPSGPWSSGARSSPVPACGGGSKWTVIRSKPLKDSVVA